MGGRRRGPVQVIEQVEFGEAALVPDPERPGGWTLLLDGTPQSYVDLADPYRLEFEYVRRLAAVIDTAAGPGTPLRVLHLGGGALTLPRYVAASRPGSVQRVAERDRALTALVRRVLPLPRGADLRVRAIDAREMVEAAPADRFDVVINDVYSGARMPGLLATAEFAAAVARVLRPGGRYAVNVTDRRPLRFVRGCAAAVRTAFPDVCLVGEPAVLRGRRFGNLVLVATAGEPLPVEDLTASVLRDPFPARLLHGGALADFLTGAQPLTDAAPVDSPEPPSALFPDW